jgi:hypothetical protein
VVVLELVVEMVVLSSLIVLRRMIGVLYLVTRCKLIAPQLYDIVSDQREGLEAVAHLEVDTILKTQFVTSVQQHVHRTLHDPHTTSGGARLRVAPHPPAACGALGLHVGWTDCCAEASQHAQPMTPARTSSSLLPDSEWPHSSSAASTPRHAASTSSRSSPQ